MCYIWQLAAPTETLDPYALLEIRPETSSEVAEAAYRAKVRTLHPDTGGSVEQMKRLNQAIEQIRKRQK